MNHLEFALHGLKNFGEKLFNLSILPNPIVTDSSYLKVVKGFIRIFTSRLMRLIEICVN